MTINTGILMDIYPLVICDIAMENDHRNSGCFPMNSMVDLSIAMLVITRGYPISYISCISCPWYTFHVVTTHHYQSLHSHLIHRQHRSGARWLFDIHPRGVHVVVEGEALVGG